ncbi:MAG: proton-conducting transporter membrane subunit [Methanoregulaceae archaeon]
MIPEIIAGSLLLLLIGTILAFLYPAIGKKTVPAGLFLVTIVASAALAAASIFILLTGRTVIFPSYQLAPGFLLSFGVDRLSAFFLFIIAVVSVAVAIYLTEYLDHIGGTTRKALFTGCLNLFILSMALVVISTGTLTFLFFWELMATCSFFLVMHEYTREETKKAGIFYFVMTQLSTLFLLLGILLLADETGSFAFSPIAGPATLPVILAFLCLFLGFSVKAGIIPFHKWLPYAHPASPSPVSALMSGVMLKIAVYGLVRFLLSVFTPDLWWGILILITGTASAVLGIIYALKEHDLKGMLAYSSIENIGIIFMGIGLSVIFTTLDLPALATLSLIGALFHSLNHALFKSLLFLTSGSVVHATGTRNIEKMGGLAQRMPQTSALFFVGAVSIAALPPTNGFASEILLYLSFFSSATVVEPSLKVLLFLCLALFALTSALSATCFVKAYGSIFLALPRSGEAESAKEVGLAMRFGPAILAAACVIFGVFSFQLLALAGYTLPIPDLFFLSLVLLMMGVLAYLALHTGSRPKPRISETWGCGTHFQEPAGEYTGYGFSEPIVTIFSVIYRTRKTNDRTFFDQKMCLFQGGKGEIRLIRFFEEYLYLPIAKQGMRFSGFIGRMQNNCLDSYLLYVFITVVAVIIFLGWFA